MCFSARVASRRRCRRHGCTPKEETRTISQLDFGCGARRICVRLPARRLQPPPFKLQLNPAEANNTLDLQLKLILYDKRDISNLTYHYENIYL